MPTEFHPILPNSGVLSTGTRKEVLPIQFPAPYDSEHLSMPRLSIVANDGLLRQVLDPKTHFEALLRLQRVCSSVIGLRVCPF